MKATTFGVYGKEPFSVHARSEGDSGQFSDAWDRGQTGVYLFCGEAIIFGGEKLFDQAVYDARGAVL